MRYLVTLVIGLLFGALLSTTAANILGRRNAYPRAVMNVMQHELARAREAVRGDACDLDGARSAGAHLGVLAGDVEGALLAPGAKDRVFSQYASDLRDAVAAFDRGGADCAARRDAATKIKNACDACHRDYK